MFSNYLGGSIGLGILSLLALAAFAILQWLHMSAGSLIDWLIGIAIFWWLFVIVTVPWNVYFDAQEVIYDAAVSRKKNIAVDEKQVNYVRKVRRWSLVVAIALHLLSALGIYTLAAIGVSAIGYFAAAATLLLTGLRPVIRAYQYLVVRLNMIRRQIKYPREDVLQLQSRVSHIETTVKSLQAQLDINKPRSWAASVQQDLQANQQKVNRLQALLEQLEAKNTVEHERLSQEARSTIAQLTEDSQFLSQVREIIRFVKTA